MKLRREIKGEKTRRWWNKDTNTTRDISSYRIPPRWDKTYSESRVLFVSTL